MADAELRALERAWATHGTVEALDVLDQARRRLGMSEHPDAAELRLRLLTRLTVRIAMRALAEHAQKIAMGWIPKPMLSAQWGLYLASCVMRLQRKAEHGGDIEVVRVWLREHGLRHEHEEANDE